MNKSKILLTLATTALLASSCATHHYTITGVERSRILIDSRYDNAQNQEAVAFLAPYILRRRRPYHHGADLYDK